MTISNETYNEKHLLQETAELLGAPWTDPTLTREHWELEDGSSIASLRWGTKPPEIVMLHGGGQNAHTWDAVGLLMGRPFVAIDLPGHGHSSWRADKEYWPFTGAKSIATVLDRMGLSNVALVGMSLGGLTAIHLASIRPAMFSRVVIVDVTPSQMEQMKKMTLEERGTTALTQGPDRYDSLQAMIDATTALAPTRPALLIERGVMHNSQQFQDGQWGWRYDSMKRPDGEDPSEFLNDDFLALWDDVDTIQVPIMLVRGGASAFVTDEHVAEFSSRAQDFRFEIVDGAGHSVQSDRPAQLAALLTEYVY
ncbi:MAG: alpha/beta hydrolase [Actinomycetota bacterium]|nr:alpha/beta hydrolase [Actinomycetota bacterium]